MPDACLQYHDNSATKGGGTPNICRAAVVHPSSPVHYFEKSTQTSLSGQQGRLERHSFQIRRMWAHALPRLCKSCCSTWPTPPLAQALVHLKLLVSRLSSPLSTSRAACVSLLIITPSIWSTNMKGVPATCQMLFWGLGSSSEQDRQGACPLEMHVRGTRQTVSGILSDSDKCYRGNRRLVCYKRTQLDFFRCS